MSQLQSIAVYTVATILFLYIAYKVALILYRRANCCGGSCGCPIKPKVKKK